MSGRLEWDDLREEEWSERRKGEHGAVIEKQLLALLAI